MSYLSVDRRVLMIRKIKRENDPNSGYFTLPGGKLEADERGPNPRGRLESVVRETLQESGLTLVSPRLRGTILFDNQGREFDNWPNPDNFLVYVFATERYTGELKESDEGIPLWVDEEEIDGLPKNPGDVKMYEWLKDFRSRFFIGVVRHKGKELDEAETFVDYF